MGYLGTFLVPPELWETHPFSSMFSPSPSPLLSFSILFFKGRKAELLCIPWLSPQMFAMTRAKARASSGTWSRSPLWAAGTPSLEPVPLPPRVYNAGSWNWELVPGTNSSTLMWASHHEKHILTLLLPLSLCSPSASDAPGSFSIVCINLHLVSVPLDL